LRGRWGGRRRRQDIAEGALQFFHPRFGRKAEVARIGECAIAHATRQRIVAGQQGERFGELPFVERVADQPGAAPVDL